MDRQMPVARICTYIVIRYDNNRAINTKLYFFMRADEFEIFSRKRWSTYFQGERMELKMINSSVDRASFNTIIPKCWSPSSFSYDLESGGGNYGNCHKGLVYVSEHRTFPVVLTPLQIQRYVRIQARARQPTRSQRRLPDWSMPPLMCNTLLLF